MTVHPIPDEALDSDIAILGKKGGGKTFTAKGIVERLLDMGRRVLVLDPLGVWAGLRTSADGDSAGYPVAIFGGAHADLPLDTAAAVSIADVLARENVPAVIDLSDLSKSAQQSFLLGFLHELRRVNQDALTLVLEEADVFAPQNPQGDDSKQLHSEIDWIARRGRFKGFRLITICQRPARLSKDVLTQAATLIVHRVPAPQDRDAIKAWVEGNGDRDEARKVFDTLATLDVGEAWVWASEQGVLKRTKFPRITTLDTSATPKAGGKRIEPKTLADVDLSAIRSALAAAAAEKQKPKKVAGDATDPKAVEEAEIRGYRRGYSDGQASERAEVVTRLRSLAHDAGNAAQAVVVLCDNLKAAIATESSIPSGSPAHDCIPAPAVRVPNPERAAVASLPRAKPSPAASGDGIPSSARKMLAVLDTNPPVRRTWTQTATLAGIKARGGHFNTGRKALLDTGAVVEEGGLVRVAKPSSGATAPTNNPRALVDTWCASLSGAAPRILSFIFDSGGTSTKSRIAEGLNLAAVGGHWNTAWKELRDNDIVVVDGDRVRLTELFQPRAPR